MLTVIIITIKPDNGHFLDHYLKWAWICLPQCSTTRRGVGRSAVRVQIAPVQDFAVPKPTGVLARLAKQRHYAATSPAQRCLRGEAERDRIEPQ